MAAAIATSGVHVAGDLSTLAPTEPGGRRAGPGDPPTARVERATWEGPDPDEAAVGDSGTEVMIPPVIAGRMALGVLHAAGGMHTPRATGAGGRLRHLAWRVTDRMRVTEPLDVARIPTVQLTGIVVRRVRRAAVARARRGLNPGNGA